MSTPSPVPLSNTTISSTMAMASSTAKAVTQATKNVTEAIVQTVTTSSIKLPITNATTVTPMPPTTLSSTTITAASTTAAAATTVSASTASVVTSTSSPIISSSSTTTATSLLTSTATSIINNVTTAATSKPGPATSNSMVFAVLATILVVTLIGAIIFAVIRKNNLERLRHHLMPVYNFDPGDDDAEDWETELLDEHINGNKTQFGTLSTSGTEQLVRLDTGLTGGLKINQGSLGRKMSLGSPTAASGLLGMGSDAANRQLYTSERNPMV